MELTLKVEKRDIDITPSEGIVSEEFALHYGHIFRGKPGKSAYEQAVDGGYEGSEEEFNSMLAQISNAPYIVTYSKLKALRDDGNLAVGAFYRITDYECITTQAETRSANHPFDIIVQALDERTLSENAQAVAREGDEYFKNANLGAWQLKYTIDNDTTRHSWAKQEVLEQPQKWECNFGILDSSYDNDSSTDYNEVIIDGKTWYLYRPVEPTSYLVDVSLYRKALGNTITSTEGFVYEADNAPYEEGYDEEDYYWYWSDVSTVQVKSADGQRIDTLHNYDGDGTFFSEKDEMQEYPITFNPSSFEYEDDFGAYSCAPDTGIDEWWLYVIGGEFAEKTYAPYDGDYSDLSYAFESPLGKTTTNVYNVSDGTYIYSTENEDDYEQAIDTVRYIAYVPHEDGGKGVIYQMIDEHNNDCPYDFKNLQFLHEGEWYYTFSFLGKDLSLTDYCAENFVYTNRMTKWDTTETPVPNALPKVIFNARPNASGKTVGITHNCLNVSVEKGYICATRIENLSWQSRMGGDLAVVNNLYVNLSGVFYGNTIYGAASTFTVGSSSEPATAFYDNEIHLATYQKKGFACNAKTFVNNNVDLTESSAGFAITAGSMTSCHIIDTYYQSNKDTDAVTFAANTILRDCVIRMYQELTINYANTTSTTAPLRFLNIDARGWDASTITIPSTFPTNAPYELKVAKNSTGAIKMWCEADIMDYIVSSINTPV